VERVGEMMELAGKGIEVQTDHPSWSVQGSEFSSFSLKNKAQIGVLVLIKWDGRDFDRGLPFLSWRILA